MLGIVRRFSLPCLVLVGSLSVANAVAQNAAPAKSAAANSAAAKTSEAKSGDAKPADAKSPWVLLNSGTTASLRGVKALAGGVVWASGTGGTVVRSEDGGYLWQACTVPKGAEKLDFRGIWAWDAQTAVVMSSGPGDASRIYKTTDGCQTWALKYTNLEPKGFWDTIIGVTAKQLFVVGDPVDGEFRIYTSRDSGETWFLTDDKGLDADPNTEGAFAASNSALTSFRLTLLFGSGGVGGAFVRYWQAGPVAQQSDGVMPMVWHRVAVPMAGGSAGTGIFSVGARSVMAHDWIVAVGGNYEKPAETAGTAAFSSDGGKTWTAAAAPPHGYRSAVAYDSKSRVWIAVGTNGSDFSRDDGKTWQPLDDGNWNALSLPYVVGNKGRIAKLADGAIPAK
jgi:photosystem II stability/assembly factor-like uncharacterized protein